MEEWEGCLHSPLHPSALFAQLSLQTHTHTCCTAPTSFPLSSALSNRHTSLVHYYSPGLPKTCNATLLREEESEGEKTGLLHLIWNGFSQKLRPFWNIINILPPPLIQKLWRNKQQCNIFLCLSFLLLMIQSCAEFVSNMISKFLSHHLKTPSYPIHGIPLVLPPICVFLPFSLY